jgi:hypothetical protein
MIRRDFLCIFLCSHSWAISSMWLHSSHLRKWDFLAQRILSKRVSRAQHPNICLIRPSLIYTHSYILGSGGTLIFDVTIVTQSFLYRSFSEKRGRRNSILSSRIIVPEEEGLLTTDEPTSAHRRRTVSDSLESDTRS